jgi:class I fructose-bisphosphate aldolase
MSKVEEILNNYKHVSPGVRGKLFQFMNTGNLKGTGKFVIYPVDQGFEHGPGRSFSKNPAGYDPLYHVELAIESGCNAYAAPLGFIQHAAAEYPGHIPLILKINNNDSLYSTPNPRSAITSTIEDALDLGCAAVGFTIYPGTAEKNDLFEQLKEITAEAHRVGLAMVVWSYPRGENLSKQGETALDVAAYAAQIAAQMGADVIKVKPPKSNIELQAAKSSYENIPNGSLPERVKHVVESAFNGRRIVIFSGGEAKDTQSVLAEIRDLKAGGSYGSIIGRNVFQRQKPEALQLLKDIMDIYKN